MPPEAVRYCGRLFSEQELQLIRTIIAEDSSRHRFALSQVVCERLHWRRANGQLKDMSCRVACCACTATASSRCRRHVGATPTAPCTGRRTPQAEPELPIIARVDELPALQVRPLADQREAQLWREYVDRYHYLRLYAAAGSTDALPGHQPAARAGGRRLWRQRLEGGPPRPLHRLERCPTRSPPAVGREQRPLPDLALGAGAQSRFHGAGSQQPPAARRLAGSLRLPTAPAGDLRAVRPLRRYQLPRRQLDPRRSDPRPRQTRRASYPRAAQERHLALPAQARLPPPTLHPGILTPTSRTNIYSAASPSPGDRR